MFGTKILEIKNSKYNGELKVIKSIGLGTYIQADGLTQSGGVVETIWKQALRKVASSKYQVASILILGLGGGTVVKLVNKYWPQAKITGIDIDSTIVNLGKKYLGLNKYQIDEKIIDAEKFIKNNNQKFDLIIVDLYNGNNFPAKFETENHIHLVRTVLSSNGITVFNRLYYGEKRPMAVKFGNKLQKNFKKVDWFYPEANLMFVCHN